MAIPSAQIIPSTMAATNAKEDSAASTLNVIFIVIVASWLSHQATGGQAHLQPTARLRRIDRRDARRKQRLRVRQGPIVAAARKKSCRIKMLQARLAGQAHKTRSDLLVV
jgi:hypothetical protein